MLSELKSVFLAILVVIYCAYIDEIFGYNISPYQTLDYRDRPPSSRPPKYMRLSGSTPSQYRVSVPKAKKPPNRVPPYLQDPNYRNSYYNSYFDLLDPYEDSTSDAIRIVDPPKYFQEQKQYYQQNPQYHYQQQGKHKNKSSKKQTKPKNNGLDLHRIQDHLPSQENYYYSAQPDYSEYPSNKHHQLNYGLGSSEFNNYNVPRPRPEALQHKPNPIRTEISQSKPLPNYSGIQTPNVESIRGQLQQFKEKQKLQFEDETDERPTRPVNSQSQRKRKPAPVKSRRTKPKPHSNTSSEEPLGYDIFKNAETEYNNLKDSLTSTRHKSSVKKNPNLPENHDLSSEKGSTPPPFVPYQLLASVRHTNRHSHKPRPSSSNPRPSSRLKTQKSHTVYSEQGFEDEEYDHGDEERFAAQHKQKHLRIKRDTNEAQNVTQTMSIVEMIEDVKELPIALSLVDANGHKLSGKTLLKHISQLIRESSRYLPNDENDDTIETSNMESILLKPEDLKMLFKKTDTSFKPKQTNSEFPFQKLDINVIPNESAINFAENLKNFNKSPYDKQQQIECYEETEPDLNQNEQKKKLGQLGDKLDCLKIKYFGKDPLGNEFFKDSIDIPDNVHSSYQVTKNKHKITPLDHVYDDVMKTIKTSLFSERLNENVYLISPLSEETLIDDYVSSKKPKQNPKGRQLKDFGSYIETTSTIPSSSLKINENKLKTFPLFDVTKYFPRVYMVRPNGKIYSIKVKPKIKSNKKLKSFSKKHPVHKKFKNKSQPLQERRKSITISTTTTTTKKPTWEIIKLKPSEIQKFTHANAIRKRQSKYGPFSISLTS